MGSSGPNPWAPYDTYKDCSLGICSIYCPQWCYVIFPPPPPDDYSGDDGSGGTYFSPLVIAVIGILASAFLLVSYYTIITKYCRRRRGSNYSLDLEDSAGDHQMNSGSWQNAAPAGLDEAAIKSIAVCKYKKGDGLVEGTDCSVCLSEFREEESLRLLPKCSHAFHLPCIDTWLKSHSSCPLCRSNIAAANHDPPPMTLPQDTVPAQEAPRPSHDIEALGSPHRDETVLEIHDDLRIEDRDEAAASHSLATSKSPFLAPGTTQDREIEIGQDDAQRIRRSVSLNSGLSQGRVSVADILRDCEDNDDDGHHHRLDCILAEDVQVETGIGPSKPPVGGGEDSNSHHGARATPQIERSPPEMKRSVSTGRFTFGRYGRGRNLIQNTPEF